MVYTHAMKTDELETLESRITALEQRNKKVELDKAWETSASRRTAIIVVTYLVVLGFLFIIKNDKPFINAIVPSIGFFLSPMAVGWLKKFWIKGKVASQAK
jgi:hypothetical protein